MSATRTYYDTYWSTGFKPTDQTLPQMLQQVLERHVQPHHRVIDVGCGDGSKTGVWHSNRAASYTGYDVSPEAVELAHQRGLEAEVVNDAARLPLPNDSADLAVTFEVLEHLFNPADALHEIRRVLKPNGIVVLTVPNVASWRHRLDFALLGRWHPGGDDLSVAQPWRDPHIRFFTLPALKRLVHHVGLEPVEIGGLQEVSVAGRHQWSGAWSAPENQALSVGTWS